MSWYDSAFPPLAARHSILMLGHSFVHRLARFARDRGCPNMTLDPSLYSIAYLSEGGMRMSGLVNQVAAIRRNRPQVVFMEIGTNDLASGVSPDSLAQEVKRFAVYLLQHENVKRVIVSQVTFRAEGSPRTPKDFNRTVTAYNATIHKLLKNVDGVKFWRHRNMWAHWQQLLSDGVHFNDTGNRRYYNSVRGAIIAATKKL